MPFEIQFDQLPVGYSAHSARANEQCFVISKEFVSSEDGQFFISRLEGFPDEILERVRPQKDFRPSSVNHLLAIVRKDCSCTVFINELSLITEIRPRRSIKKGELVTKNDVVDTGRLILENTQVPPDAGVVFLFSVGWRKGLFMDLTPIVPDGSPRVQDLEILFGRYFRYLLFQERLRCRAEIRYPD